MRAQKFGKFEFSPCCLRKVWGNRACWPACEAIAAGRRKSPAAETQDRPTPTHSHSHHHDMTTMIIMITSTIITITINILQCYNYVESSNSSASSYHLLNGLCCRAQTIECPRQTCSHPQRQTFQQKEERYRKDTDMFDNGQAIQAPT